MRVPYEEMVKEFARVLEKKGFQKGDAENAAVIFAQNSLAGVFSHGLNRFPRVVSYLKRERSIRTQEQPARCRWVPLNAGMVIEDLVL